MTLKIVLTLTALFVGSVSAQYLCQSAVASTPTCVKPVSTCCNRELILPPPTPQLPCGFGFLPAAIPLLNGAYTGPCGCGSTSCSCGNCGSGSCGCSNYGLGSCGCNNGGCSTCGSNSCGCQTGGCSNCGTGSCGCGTICSCEYFPVSPPYCGTTLATPLCPGISTLARPIVL